MPMHAHESLAQIDKSKRFVGRLVQGEGRIPRDVSWHRALSKDHEMSSGTECIAPTLCGG